MAFTYILECADGSMYVGSTRDLERRVAEHNSDTDGAVYTRRRRPVRLLWAAEFEQSARRTPSRSRSRAGADASGRPWSRGSGACCRSSPAARGGSGADDRALGGVETLASASSSTSEGGGRHQSMTAALQI
ncbi:MAG: GIY-YIG nuclease family protein [Nocardioides sp.]